MDEEQYRLEEEKFHSSRNMGTLIPSFRTKFSLKDMSMPSMSIHEDEIPLAEINEHEIPLVEVKVDDVIKTKDIFNGKATNSLW